MAVKLNKTGERHAAGLIASGKYDVNSSWSFDAADGDKLLGSGGDDWSAYAKWFLAENDDQTENTKGRYEYPFGKDGKVYRRALVAIRSRAAQNSATAVFDAAGRLIDAIDKKEGKDEQAAPAALADADVDRIAARVAEKTTDNLRHGMVSRAAQMVPGSFDDSSRTIDMVISSGAAVRRYDWQRQQDYDEVLDVSPKAVRMGRLNAGAPFLDSHNAFGGIDNILGAVVPGSARIENGQLRGRVKFSTSPRGEQAMQDAKAGILRHVSVGYLTHKTEIDDTKSPPVYRATDWEPHEVSAVPIPADPHAGFRSATVADIPTLAGLRRRLARAALR